MLGVINVVGARPNFIKMAPIIEAMQKYPDRFQPLLVHTGQHYDERMSKSFFVDLGMPKPDLNLEVGSGSRLSCRADRPDLGRVRESLLEPRARPGDRGWGYQLDDGMHDRRQETGGNHVEAGLRSRDMSMSEEINRLCTDVLCDYLFTTDHFANENLIAEGVAPEKIFFVGNVMIDTLLRHLELARRLGLIEQWGLKPGGFATLTLHRPSNVDDPVVFRGILDALTAISNEIPIIFPIHPRTRKMAEQFGFRDYFSMTSQPRGLWITEPLGYLELLHLNVNARMVITDSGGVQEETTVLGVPCITLRNNTERPITCEVGTNVVVGNSRDKILHQATAVLKGEASPGKVPEKWDGKAAERIVQILANLDIKRSCPA